MVRNQPFEQELKKLQNVVAQLKPAGKTPWNDNAQLIIAGQQAKQEETIANGYLWWLDDSNLSALTFMRDQDRNSFSLLNHNIMFELEDLLRSPVHRKGLVVPPYDIKGNLEHHQELPLYQEAIEEYVRRTTGKSPAEFIMDQGLFDHCAIFVRANQLSLPMYTIGQLTDTQFNWKTSKGKDDLAVWWLTLGELEILSYTIDQPDEANASDTLLVSQLPEYLQRCISSVMEMMYEAALGEIHVPRQGGGRTWSGSVADVRHAIDDFNFYTMVDGVDLSKRAGFVMSAIEAEHLPAGWGVIQYTPDKIDYNLDRPAIGNVNNEYVYWWLHWDQMEEAIKAKYTPDYAVAAMDEAFSAITHPSVNKASCIIPPVLKGMGDHVVMTTYEASRPLDPDGKPRYNVGVLIRKEDCHEKMCKLSLVTDTQGDVVWPVRMVLPGDKTGNVFLSPDEIRRASEELSAHLVVWWNTPDEATACARRTDLPAYVADAISLVSDLGKEAELIEIIEIPPMLSNRYPYIRQVLHQNHPYDIEGRNGVVVLKSDVSLLESISGVFTTLEMGMYDHPSWIDEHDDLIHQKKYSAAEVRELFLQHIRGIIDYWGQQHPNDGKEAASGVAHSFCAAIAGCTIGLPGFYLVPMGNDEDNEYYLNSGQRPWPIVPKAIADSLCDIGGGLNSYLYAEPVKIPHCRLWLTPKEWHDGHVGQKWAYACEVQISETAFIKARIKSEGIMALYNAYRELCAVCLKHGAFFVPDQWMDISDYTYVFRWATDDDGVLAKMLAELKGYSLVGHF